MKNLENRILKTELIKWRKLKWLQSKTLKEMSKESFQKLKNSLAKNKFIFPFTVWEDKKEIMILDGHHRQRAMEELEKEGYSIPDMLPANFVECKNHKEAAKLILIYSTIYANITEEGLYETLNLEQLDFDEVKQQVELPKINLKRFEEGYYGEQGEEKEDPEKGFIECPECGHKWKRGK